MLHEEQLVHTCHTGAGSSEGKRGRERQKEVPMSMTREQRDHEQMRGLRESENENQTGHGQHIWYLHR